MLALISLFIVIFISIIIVKIAAIALALTGLSEEIASFQALSAFTGAGFTTDESETIIKHPLRRKIAMFLMMLGSAGLATVVASLVLTFVNTDISDLLAYAGYIFLGLLVLWFVVQSEFVHHILNLIMQKALERFSNMSLYDYHEILGLGQGFVISKVHAEANTWMCKKALKDMKLDREGTLILNIERKVDGKLQFMGAPNGKTVIQLGDILTCYGRPEAIMSLVERSKGSSGDKEHKQLCLELKDKEEVIIEEQVD